MRSPSASWKHTIEYKEEKKPTLRIMNTVIILISPINDTILSETNSDSGNTRSRIKCLEIISTSVDRSHPLRALHLNQVNKAIRSRNKNVNNGPRIRMKDVRQHSIVLTIGCICKSYLSKSPHKFRNTKLTSLLKHL